MDTEDLLIWTRRARLRGSAHQSLSGASSVSVVSAAASLVSPHGANLLQPQSPAGAAGSRPRASSAGSSALMDVAASSTAMSTALPAVTSRTFLLDALSRHYLFSALSGSELEAVAAAMAAVPMCSGELAVTAGDILYHAFFVVERGDFDVHDATGAYIETVTAGGAFGESALLFAAPAEHSVRAAFSSRSTQPQMPTATAALTTAAASPVATANAIDGGSDACDVEEQLRRRAAALHIRSPGAGDAPQALRRQPSAAGGLRASAATAVLSPKGVPPLQLTRQSSIRSMASVAAGLASVLQDAATQVSGSGTGTGAGANAGSGAVGTSIASPHSPSGESPHGTAARGGKRRRSLSPLSSPRFFAASPRAPAATPRLLSLPKAAVAAAAAAAAARASPPSQATASHLVWRLDRRTLRRVLASASEANMAATRAALRSVPLLRPLTDAQRNCLAPAVREVSASRSSVIVTAGTPCESLFYVLAGELTCVAAGSDVGSADVHLHAGSCFGERALLCSDTTNAATVTVASATARLLRLDSLDLTALLGPLQDVLDTNVVEGALRRAPSLASAPAPALARLAAARIPLRSECGATIACENERLVVVCEGAVELRHATGAAAGAPLTAGDCWGAAARDNGLHDGASVAIALSPVVRCFTFPPAEVASALTAAVEAAATQGAASTPPVTRPQSPASVSAPSSPAPEAAAAPAAAAADASGGAPVQPTDGTLALLRAAAQPLATGMRLADLERIVTVGVGTFGRVFLVRHAPTGALYALKVLKKALVHKMNQARNVEFERAVLAAVRHPFLLRLVATFQTEQRLYMLTEYVRGGELFSRLVAEDVLEPAHARFYAACTLAGLAHLHALGIVYRDLKPENLLLDADGYIRIVDFGFCKHVAPGDRTYTLCGTPAYIAYEMAKRTGYTHAVDYWSLGTLIFEMLVGYAPFEGDDQMSTIRNILTGTLTIPPQLVAADPAAADIITQLLARNVVDRLGCRRDGAAEIFRHPWFASIDFDALLRKEMPAPWRPEPADEAVADDRGDARYFDTYDESEGEAEGPRPARNVTDDARGDKGSVNGAEEIKKDGDGGNDDDDDDDDDDEEEDGGDAFVLTDELPARLLSPSASPATSARVPADATSGAAAAPAVSAAAASAADEARFFADF